MINVLHYLCDLGLGGTQKTCQLFCKHLDRKEFNVFLAYKGDDKSNPRYKLFVDAVGEDHMYRIEEPLDLREVIDWQSIDILHTYRSGFREFPEPGVDIDVPHFVETNIFGHLDRNALIDRTLFMSKWLMTYALRGRTGPRFDFVNNPVEYASSCRSLVLEREEKTIWLGRCGRPDNGIYNAVSVEAARLLRLQGYDVRFLVMAAPSNMIADLKKYEIPYLAMEPTVDPGMLDCFYNSVDIYAHARADGETFGVNIAEAMMHGKPVVTHVATPSFPGMGVFQSQTELVDHYKTGLIVDNDPAEYANALKELIDDKQLRDECGIRGKVKAQKEYLASVCTQKLEGIYKDIING